MLLLVAVPEWSIARKVCPTSPAELIPPNTSAPPRSTAVTRSKVGVTLPFCALLDRAHQNPFEPSPPTKTLPLLSTSSVPNWGELGIPTGVVQVTPPSVDRLNSPGALHV